MSLNHLSDSFQKSESFADETMLRSLIHEGWSQVIVVVRRL